MPSKTYIITTDDGKEWEVEVEEPGFGSRLASTMGAGVESLSNLPASATRFAGNLAQAALSPIETLKGVASTIREASSFAPPFVPGAGLPPSPEGTPHLNALVDYVKSRYGSLDALGDTIKTDPVGFLADISSVAGGARLLGGTRAMGRAAGVVEEAANPLNIAKGVARGAKALVGGPTAGARQRMAERIYSTSAKLKGKTPSQARNIAKTGIREKLPANEAGIAKAKDKVFQTNRAIEADLAEKAAQGATVDPSRVAAAGIETASGYHNPSVLGTRKEVGDALKAVREYLEVNSTEPRIPPAPTGGRAFPPSRTPESAVEQPTPISTVYSQPVDRAFQGYQRNNRTLQREYKARKVGGPRDLSDSAAETYVDMNKALRNQIVEAAPEIDPALNYEKRLIEWGEGVLPAVTRELSTTPVGELGSPMWTAAGARFLTHEPVFAYGLGAIKGATNIPSMGTRLAIGIAPDVLPPKPGWFSKYAVPPAPVSSRLPEALQERKR